MAVLADLQVTLEKAVADAGLPGAGLAVLHDGEVLEAAAGVLNIRTGVDVTVDSLFQIGSITKVYTATLVMQLVDAGLVELDAPVRTYLPTFAVADANASAAITVRHVLTHTSGFDGGDWFFDGGRGDDTVERYVASLADLDQISAPGAHWSYNNAGFGVLGRIVEVLTDQTWDDALRERLLQPARLDHSVTLPEEALLFRTAAGHQVGEDGVELVKTWGLNRSSGPAGLICAAARDVVGFARLHLDGGGGVLSPESVAAMQQPQVELPGSRTASMGLGWLVQTFDRTTTVGHNGGTLGQAAFLTAVPDRAFAIALLTNGPTGAAVWKQVTAAVTDELGLPPLTVAMPTPPPAPPSLDLSRYVGRYERKTVHTTISIEDDHLLATMAYVDVPYDLKPPPPLPLTAVDETTFVVVGPDGEPTMPMQFLEPDADGRPQLLFAARLARRAT